jgi:murein DD-endopeptidase MepM/ murein hydrolase activator NlpD
MYRWIPAVVMAGSIAVVFHQTRESTPETATVVTRTPVPPPPPKVFDVLHTIDRGETLSVILENVGLPSHDIQEAAKPFYDLANIRAGRTITFKMRQGETTPHIVLYPLDEDNTVRVERTGDTWTAAVDTIEYESTEAIREFNVESTFWGAAAKAGLRASDIVKLASVFKFDVDFNTELRGGAQVKMVIEELYTDGRFAKLGTPLAVRLENNGHEFLAIHHENDDGEVGYYDLKGVARKKAFLRSPLPFSRVTSGFNPRRYHPVLKKRRPHNGTDFGAPQGTAIRATGSGTVVSSGRNGGHGNFVKIDHPGPYASSYSHMHKIKVKRGQKVKQGQIIGTVGSTGMSTGPHLHYQFWKNNRFVNPMTADLPRTQKLPSGEIARFENNKNTWVDFMDGVTPSVAMTDPQ